MQKHLIKYKLDEISWIKKYKKINGRKISKKTIKKLHIWIHNNPWVVKSPLTNDYVNIKDNKIDEVIKNNSYLFKYQ